jgi:hypothetical protein
MPCITYEPAVDATVDFPGLVVQAGVVGNKATYSTL